MTVVIYDYLDYSNTSYDDISVYDSIEKILEYCKKNIEDNYLQLSQHSLRNIQTLVEDLDHTKKYLNFLKRKITTKS